MNTDNPKQTLFHDFAPLSKADWTEKATADLKGAEPDKKLLWKNSNGIAIAPYYARGDLKNRLQNTGRIDKYPVNYRRIRATSAEKANASALLAIREGMTGLIFELTGPCEPAVLLQGIDLGALAVSYELDGRSLDQVRALDAHFRKNGTDLKRIRGYVDLGIWRHCLKNKQLDANLLDDQAETSKLLRDYPGWRSVCITGTEFSDAGASQVQEMAFTLSAIVQLIEELSDRGLEA